MISNNEKKALQAQLEEIKEYGVVNTGYYWEVFEKLEYPLMFGLLEDAINDGLISGNLKAGDLMNYTLASYIEKMNPEKEYDLKHFSKFNDCFMNYSTYTATLEELEKNNGAEK